MIIVTPVGAPETNRGERIFQSHIKDHPGVMLANVNVPNGASPGAFTREVDGVVITPAGMYTVEVKGLRARGVLHTSRMDAWLVVEGDLTVPMMGRPHAQALTHSKYLASFLKETGVVSGWVQAVLVIVGDGIVLPEGVEVLTADNVHVVVSGPNVGEVLREQVVSPMGQQEISVEAAQALLTIFECVESGPSTEDLVAQGFRPEAAIADDLEVKRQQVREEFLASAQAAGEAPPADAGADLSVLDAPTTTEWRATAERFAEVQQLDAELTETGAVVEGVALHRRLVSYAGRKSISLELIAAVVNTPEEVWGEESEHTRVFCGGGWAVSVRVLDGLALYFKDIAVATAETNGATVHGVEITARAAKGALNHMDLSLEAVARVVVSPQERWWIPGTTDVAHARGDVVAVTSGSTGPVQYVQSRALAVARSAPKPVEDDAKVTEVKAGEFTLRASAVNWCRRRRVDVAEIAVVTTSPTSTWAGHSENMEVRAGASYAVLVDTEGMEVVAVMTATEAVEYRDGIVRDGVHLSGRCLFLLRRREVAVEDVVAAVKAPVLIAREPGAAQSVYVGLKLAVTVDDETRAVVDFTYPDHARSMVARGSLMAVDLPGCPVDATAADPAGPAVPVLAKPSPTVFAAMADAAARAGMGSVGEVLVGSGEEREDGAVLVAVGAPSPLRMPSRRP